MFESEKRNSLAIAIILAQVAGLSLTVNPVEALDFNPLPFKTGQQDPLQLRNRQQDPIQFKKKEASLEDLVERIDIPFTFMQPVPLGGVKISGLAPKSITELGLNYFIVVNNTKYKQMYEIYRDNRINNKPNYVTADCVVHPYLCFTNRVYASFINKQLMHDLDDLVGAMLKIALADYQQAQDDDVKEDIERNIAFLSLAGALANPNFSIPKIGKVPELVAADLKAMESGKKAASAIFSQDVDFTSFVPVGWYLSSPELIRFYKCKEWLSRIDLPVTDVTIGTNGNLTNNFRRSVLLFRSLDLAQIQGKPAVDVLTRLNKYFCALGCQIENYQERTIYPQDYKLMFRSNSSDLKVTMSALAEPFYRTKLLLAIRRQKPVNLNSTSIFDLSERAALAEAPAKFRLFPVTGEPEISWLRNIANVYPQDNSGPATFPLGLIDMHVWGGAQANNILLNNIWAIDPSVAKYLVDLKKQVVRRLPAGQTEPVENRRWQLLSPYFHLPPEATQSVFKSEFWMTRRLESAFAAWLDSVLSLAPPVSKTNNPASSPASSSASNPPSKPKSESSTNSTNSVAGSVSINNRAKITSHYLEPDAEMFLKLSADVRNFTSDSLMLANMDEPTKQRFNDFTRLFDRLTKIAQAELSYTPVTLIDNKLLGNIDYILEKIDEPLVATMPVENNNSTPEQKQGFTLALGNPGQLFVIMQNKNTMKWSLGRGAVYTYYEIPKVVTQKQWMSTLETGTMKLLPWTEKFDLIQIPALKKQEQQRL